METSNFPNAGFDLRLAGGRLSNMPRAQRCAFCRARRCLGGVMERSLHLGSYVFFSHGLKHKC